MSKRWNEHLRMAAVLFGLLSAATGTAPAAIAADHASPIVRTTEGPVQGFVRNGVDQFLGVPYAAPPIGDLRWQPPKPHAAWTETLSAIRFGNTCPQITMNGAVADEGAFAASIDDLFFGPMSAERYVKLVNITYGGPAGPGVGPPDYPAGTPDKVMEKYPLKTYPTPGAAWTAVATDANVCRHPYLNNHASQFVPLYAYEFADRKAPWYFPPVNFDHGAAHTIDIQFLFPDWHGGPLGILHRLTPEERVLSGQLVAAWTNFMYAGNPNLKGDRPWPHYAKGMEAYLSQNVTGLTPITSAQFAAAHNCAFWDTILIYETPSRS
jgi:para-nitrobenzyl esterase